MPPGRKKAGTQGETKGHLSVGDLVLAKVKGFPAWPAKISRPEDWDRSPDPKKCFVQFFGTSEIAFIAPADIQVFNIESKSKLVVRSRGKCAKDFGRAVEEICEAYQQLHGKRSEKRSDDAAGSAIRLLPSASNAVQDNKLNETSKSEDRAGMLKQETQTDDECSQDEFTVLKHSWQVQDGSCPPDEKNRDLDKDCKTMTASDSVKNLKGRSELVSERPSKFSSRRDEKSPSSCTDLGKENGMTECFESKRVDGKLKPSAVNSPQDLVSEKKGNVGAPKLHKKNAAQKQVKYTTYESAHKRSKSEKKFEDEHDGRLVSPLDRGRVKFSHSPVSDSDAVSEKRSKGSRKSKKVAVGKGKSPLDHDRMNTKLSTTKERDSEISVKKTLVSNRKRGMEVSEQSQAKRSRHDIDVGKKSKRLDTDDSSSILRDREGKMLMDNSSSSKKSGKFSPSAAEPLINMVRLTGKKAVTVSTEGAEHGRGSGLRKKDTQLSDQKKSPSHTHARRRTFRIDDDEDDEIHRTPIHRKHDRMGSPKPNDMFYKDKISLDKLEHRVQQSPGHSEERRPEKFVGKHVSHSPGKQEHQRSSSREPRMITQSPKASVKPSSAGKQVESKIKISTVVSVKTHTVSSKHLTGNFDELSRFNHAIPQKAKQSTLEKAKGAQKADLLMNAVMENKTNVNFSAERSADKDFSIDERLVAANDRSASSIAESSTSDCTTSMKHLIAVAQAKRREAHLQGHSHDRIVGLVSSPAVARERSPSPLSVVQDISTISFIQKDNRESLSSPTSASQNCVTVGCVEPEGHHERSASPGGLPPQGSLSGGTEAAVARDTLEGMIETLSRTKESIGRATRLAIDCAKYGIANETALRRLLAAAAPAGSVASENRRQCLKVLRLWLERKIFPESVLRPLMDGIEVSNDGSNSGIFLRRPSRAERSVDDPIRDMDGMLVDEYGSNVAFKLPGFISTHVFEDEEDLPGSLSGDAGNESPIEGTTAVVIPGTTIIHPSDRRHLILEDVDGELEMEDASKDDRVLVRISLKQQLEPPIAHPSSSSLAYRPAHQDYSRMPNGHSNASVKTDAAVQQSPSFARSAVCNTQPIPSVGTSRPYEFGQNGMYAEPQGCRSNQQFQPAGTSFMQRSYNVLTPGHSMTSFPAPSGQVLTHYHASATQPTPNHFPFVNSMSEHHAQQQYHAYSLPSDPNDRRHYIAEEQWRKHSGNVSLESQQSSWVAGGRGPAPSGAAYVQDGSYSSNVDRQPQEIHPPHSVAPPVAPVSGPHT
ncbi:unnamed protein product [Spirodela intermedia]|uniref:PWWP domain-containing protein n=1 Tax=Spirodela intermedia TaxID=51605 RepID=A0A7I8K3W7_SPIIN|nr:unnamed protein product [Spirodela intermedia]